MLTVKKQSFLTLLDMHIISRKLIKLKEYKIFEYFILKQVICEFKNRILRFT